MERLGYLLIRRSVSPDGNFYNPDRIQVSDAPRVTERDAEQRIAYGRLIDAPPAKTNILNGQLVDTDTMLMCSRCCAWKTDDKFRHRQRNMNTRRGRGYYCKTCLSTSTLYMPQDEDETPKQERRKKRR